MAITQQDRYEWAHSPVTKEFLEILQNARDDTKEAWAMEKYIEENVEKTALANAAALGGLRVLDQAIAIIETNQGDDGNDPITAEPKTHTTIEG